jgi:hypothetical protein
MLMVMGGLPRGRDAAADRRFSAAAIVIEAAAGRQGVFGEPETMWKCAARR